MKKEMVTKIEKIIGLSELRKLGVFEVNLEGETYTAPFSKKPCVWYSWIYKEKDDVLLNGFTHGTHTDSEIMIRSSIGDVRIYPSELQPYLRTSFHGDVVLDGREVIVEEFSLERGPTYYATVEKFTYPLPPLLLFPRRRSTLLLALSDEPFIKDRPSQPLIPPYRGRTG